MTAKIASVNPANGEVLWRGEVTAAVMEEVWEQFAKDFHGRESEVDHIIIDLRDVRFMDSSGVGLLIRAQKMAATEGVELRCRNPQPAVDNVLRISKMRRRLLGE